ncbi:hypothetical protein [Methylobacterium sp. P1-11]|uniref:hypothetical protein n=1 Tax=Methylobacterium sp. P1-11 TaxID=2024616 RepID=UPI0011EEC547|nr:hypothetical protein [Methylobacterium sp. P1-11]
MIIEPSAPIRVVFKRGSGRRTEAGQVWGLPVWTCARTGAGRSATDVHGVRDRVLLAGARRSGRLSAPAELRLPPVLP